MSENTAITHTPSSLKLSFVNMWGNIIFQVIQIVLVILFVFSSIGVSSCDHWHHSGDRNHGQHHSN